MMKILIGSSIIVILFSIFAAMRLLTVSIQPDYDLFYFVQRWPGAECSGVKDCCFSTTGKPPAAFGIHGLWPEYANGTRVPKCPSKKPRFDPALIEDLKPSLEKEWPSLACPRHKDSSKLWKHEWEKHGICSLSTLTTQHAYFDASLKLKAKKNLLQILKDAKIEPNGNMYSFGAILEALTQGIGSVPGIDCNEDKTSKNIKQLYEVIICVDKSGSNFMDCPVYPRMSCGKNTQIKFPKFGVRSSELKAEL